MKKVVILLSLVLMIVISLIATTLFKSVSYEISDSLQLFLDDNNLQIESRVSEGLYITTDGQYVQAFPMIDSSDSANAAIFYYDSTAADGHVWATNTTYSSTHDVASGTVVAGGNTLRVGQQKPTPASYEIYRGAVFFDTSAIPDDSIISEAGVYLSVGGDYSENDFWIVLVSGDGLGTSLSASDYGLLGTADSILSAVNTNTSVTAGSYTGFGLNAGGISDISLNGTTAYGLRSYEDIREDAPLGTTLAMIYPEADGGTIERDPNPGALDNYDCYDELSTNYWVDYTDVVWWGVAAWFEDQFTMTDLGTINGSAPASVQVMVTTATGTDCQSPPCYCWEMPLLRINGTTYNTDCYIAGKSYPDLSGMNCKLWSTTFSTRTSTWTTNPATTNAWNWSEINDLEGVVTGLEQYHSDADCYISTYQIGVEYTPAGSGMEFVDFSAFEQGAGSIPYLYVAYTVGNVPGPPTDLLVNDEEHPVTDDYTPYFSAVGHHVDAGATMNWYSMQVDDQQSFASPMWSSGQVAFTTNITDGQRCENIEYAGLPFSLGTRYYWRIAFYDDDQDISPWSSTSWFDFTTPATCPDNLVAEPLSHNEIRLTWDNADIDFTYGALYFKTVGYPAARADGTRLYLGPGEAYTHKGLEAGTNYYYRVWGYDSASGNYSTGTCYASDWATTLAGETDGPTPPLVPPEWSQYPTCEVYEGVPFIHDLITDAYATNGSTTHYDVPDETACLLCTFGFLLMFGLTGYFVTRRNELVLVGILCVGIIAASIAGAMPMWFIAFAVVGAIYLFVKVRA